MQFLNKHAIITGGSRGIGRAIVERFLELGCIVTTIDIESPEPYKGDVNPNFFYGDIAKKDVLENFIESLSGRSVDFLINNACIGRGGLLSGCSHEHFSEVLAVGAIAPYYLVQMLHSRGLLVKGSSIVNISSTRASQSQPNTEAYTAAKGAVLSLTHALAASLAGHSRVNSVSPGWIDTLGAIKSTADELQHSVQRVGEPVDIVHMVEFLCDCEKSGFITGQNFIVDGGMSSKMIYHGDDGWKFTP